MKAMQPISVSRMIHHGRQNQEAGAVFELALSDKLTKRYGHAPWTGTGYALPTRRAVRDLQAATASAGGDLVGESIARVAASIRPTFKLEAAGMTVTEVGAVGSHHMPRFTSASAAMIAESGAAPSLSTGISTVSFTPKTACARLGFTRKISLQTEDAEGVVLGEISRAVASLINGQIITGSGSSNEFLGIEALPDAQSVSFSAATPTLTELSNLLEKAGDADVDLDADSVVWLLHPSDLRDLLIAEQVASTGELIMRWSEGSYRLFGKRVLTSSSVTEGKHLLLDAQYLHLVLFGSGQVVVDKYSSSKSLTGATEIVVLNNADFGCTYQSAVVVGSA